jgi:NTE family protein
LIVVRAAPGSRDNIKTAITRTVFSFDDYDFMHRKKINLALQGGGAYGAFTWGVLDHLLEDRRLEIEGITGASSGAINAVMLADGLARGGPREARKRLADFWRAASFNGNLPEGQRRALDRLFAVLPIGDSPSGVWFDALSKCLSPHDINPLNINPLKDLIIRFVDFEAIRKQPNPLLFISATNVHTGRLRIFGHEKISADTVLASACLPFLFHAVEIDGVPYWDGGYLGNPAIFPLFAVTETEDVLLVQINPLVRKITPTSIQDIMSRLNEITFNSPLIGELRAIEFVGRLIDRGLLPRGIGSGKYRRVNVHRVALEGSALNTASRLNNDFNFFEMLCNNGRRAVREFLDVHFDDIGARCTVDLASEVRAEWA